MLFNRQNKSVKRSNQFIWFKKWVLHRQTIPYLSKQSGYSVRTLKTLFDYYLKRPPVLSFYPSEKLNLLIDGTYFSNNICLIVYRDNEIKFTQLYRISDGEYYSEIKEDLENLLRLGIQIESITCDGHKSIIKAIKTVCAQVVLQRCLVHIQRECRLWLTTHPKSLPGLSLLSIVNNLHTIRTHEQSQKWMIEIYNWHITHKEYIQQKSISPNTKRYWFKHKMVRRAFIHIKNALPYMIEFLFNKRVPKTTNGLNHSLVILKAICYCTEG